MLGGGDVAEEWRDGDDRVGGKRSIVGDVVERGGAASVARRPRLAVGAQSGTVSPRIYVHNLLRLSHLRQLTHTLTATNCQSFIAPAASRQPYLLVVVSSTSTTAGVVTTSVF